MKAIMNYLVFDREMVEKLKTSKMDKNLLYNQLISGKITMSEYLRLGK